MLQPVSLAPRVSIVGIQAIVYGGDKKEDFWWGLYVQLAVVPAGGRPAVFLLRDVVARLAFLDGNAPYRMGRRTICPIDEFEPEVAKHMAAFERPGIMSIALNGRPDVNHEDLDGDIELTMAVTADGIEAAFEFRESLRPWKGRTYTGNQVKTWAHGPYDGGESSFFSSAARISKRRR